MALDFIGDFVIGCEVDFVAFVVGALVIFFFFDTIAVNNKQFN